MPQDSTEVKSKNKKDVPGVGVFASKCGWRGKEAELCDGKCPRCGDTVVETRSPQLRQEAYEKFGGLSYEDYQAEQDKPKAASA